MKVSLNWLKEYISVDLEPARISEELTMAGLEVDSVEPRYDYLDLVVVAKVVEVAKHPNADKLSVCQVDAGQDKRLQIVCGAPNVRENMTVACALIGAVLPGDFKIKKGKLRGEVSEGMLCSAAELKLDSDASGIMDLDGALDVGMSLEKALKLTDTVFEIDLTPNRPDCLSMIGVAREVGAFKGVGKKISLPDVTWPQDRISTESIHDHAAVEILDPDLCPRYSAGYLFDVKVGPSPFWLQEKLEAIGLTPINNVVDITNFVMMETGQPLHAFDFDQVEKSKIVVRKAGVDREFVTLDSKTHKLNADMLMICDGAKPVGVAGVMGGENSEIQDTTTRVLIESAYFNPVSIRKTAKLTGIASDASHRFERGVDPEGTLFALNRAVSLMAELCDAKIAKDIIDVYPKQYQPVAVEVDPKALNVRLGTNLSADAICRILESVAFKVVSKSDDLLRVEVPSFRVDVARPEDLSEEVARLWGYNNIVTSYPNVPAEGRPLRPILGLRKRIRQIMTGFSFTEAINYNFVHEKSCDRLNLSDADRKRDVVNILNPISDQLSVLRSSLVPGLLETMKRNTAQQQETLMLFEIGKVFTNTDKTELPQEDEMLAGLITGARRDQSWYSKKIPMDFFDLKGVVEGLLTTLKIVNVQFERAPAELYPYYKRGEAAVLKVGDVLIGALGTIDGGVLKNFGLKQDAFVFDFNLGVVQELMPEVVTAQIVPKFPALSRDITIIVGKNVPVGRIVGQINDMAFKNKQIESAFLFDLFEGSPVPEGKKSVSIRVVYRDPGKTLKEKNVKQLHARITQELMEEFKADLPE